jgi:outer membrane usher protein FimD/PapC
MKSVLCLFLLASAVAPAVNATPAGNAATVDATSTVNVLVTDRRGKPLSSARVIVNGESAREGNTNRAGRVVFTDMKAGSYILRVERDKFITFEKDFAVRLQRGSTQVVAAISPSAPPAARVSRR